MPISRSRNAVSNPLPQEEPLEELLAVSPFKTLVTSVEKDAKLFIQEEDDLGEALGATHARTVKMSTKRAETPSFWPLLCFLERGYQISHHH
jgi:hypothetical protein